MKAIKLTESLELEIEAELLEIKELNALITRKGKGANKNIIARKEIAYVFHMGAPKSPYANYSDADRKKKLKADLFFDYPDWEPDDIVENACNKFKELKKTASSRAVRSMIDSLYECQGIVDEVTKQLKQNLAEGKHKTGINNKRGQIVSGVELMLNDLTALLKVSKEIPAHVETLEKVLMKLENEQSQAAAKSRGNSYINPRER